MDFRANDPGAVQFGNFINYYQFNSAAERIDLLPDDVWLPVNTSESNESLPYLVLDVGCNTGDVTQLLLEFLSKRIERPIYILGVEIDPMLIKRAKETNKKCQHIKLECVDIMKEDESWVIKDFLQSHDAEKFDAVCCFSITMWIHLNHGDCGLQEFLSKCSSKAKLFVVEPQPWKCYRTAVRRMKRSANECFPNFTELKWRTNVEGEINNYLVKDLHRTKIYETYPTKWMRKICFYR